MVNTSKPLKICLISYRSNPHCGGQGVYIRNLSRALVDLGHSVDVLSGPPDPQLDDDVNLIMLPCLDLFDPEDMFRIPSLKELSNPINMIEWIGVSTMGFPEMFTFGLRAYKYLLKNHKKYDIIHDNQCLSYGIAAIKRLVPTTITIHHPITVDRDIALKSVSSYWKKIKHLRWFSFLGMQKNTSKSFSHIITVSKSAQNDISNEFKINKSNFNVIPNGINTDLFYPVPEIEREDGRIIVTNSADTPLKGLFYLIHAIKEVLNTHKNIKLVVIGKPKENGGIVRLIKKLKIYDFIHFTGRISNREFRQQYAKANMAVVPSIYEGFGLPVGEAMACGVPVISTTGGALPEVLGDAGILVPPANSKALANAIRYLLEHKEYAKKIGKFGYLRVHEKFTWNNAAKQTVETYREVINDHHRS